MVQCKECNKYFICKEKNKVATIATAARYLRWNSLGMQIFFGKNL